jgi:predicted GH43/DUF377 family glycosyl hydrolase
MWFTGREENGNLDGPGIGHATSPDGVDWTMDPANPVLSNGVDGEWDYSYVIAGSVIHDGSQFHMWYSGRSDSDDRDNVGYATSPDGTVWTKYAGNPVTGHGPPGSWDDTYFGPTAVIEDGGTFKMWFMGSRGDFISAKIGYADSPDGIVWNKRPDPVLESGDYPGTWEAGILDASVVFDGATYHMWYVADYPNVASKVGYAFSGDGIEWTKHRGNPVVEVGENMWNPCVLSDGTTWHMWFTHHLGGSNPLRVSYATSDCCAGVAALDNWQFIPAAAVASGAQGAFFQTDVDVSNAGDRAVEYEFSWLPRGETNSEPVTSGVFTLGAGMSARYANVLSEVFDLEPDSLGALLIKSSNPDLLAMSRTYNLQSEKAGGTFGQSMPAFTLSDFISYGETRRILFGTESAEMRTNIGCQNGNSSNTVVYLDLFDAGGSALGRETKLLKPLGNEQVNRIFEGHNPVNGYVDVSVALAGNLVYCYGSVLDNMTSDPTTIPPQ